MLDATTRLQLYRARLCHSVPQSTIAQRGNTSPVATVPRHPSEGAKTYLESGVWKTTEKMCVMSVVTGAVGAARWGTRRRLIWRPCPIDGRFGPHWPGRSTQIWPLGTKSIVSTRQSVLPWNCSETFLCRLQCFGVALCPTCTCGRGFYLGDKADCKGTAAQLLSPLPRVVSTPSLVSALAEKRFSRRVRRWRALCWRTPTGLALRLWGRKVAMNARSSGRAGSTTVQ